MANAIEFLRNITLFANLAQPDLEKICRRVNEVSLKAGESLFEEGSMGESAYVIKEGAIEIYKTANGHPVQLAVRRSGEVIGELSILEATPRTASGRALTDSILLEIGREQFDTLLDSSPQAARTMLHTVAARLRSTEVHLRQSEKMAQLGTFTAGIAHELNNPSAAVLRGADQIKKVLEEYRQALVGLYSAGLSSEDVQMTSQIVRLEPQWERISTTLDPLARSDLEIQIEAWLDDHAVDDPWQLAPQLAELDFEVTTLDTLAAQFPPTALGKVVAWISVESRLHSMVEEIYQGAERVSEIVKALKAYVYLDQAPRQEIDIHEGLENTLVILRYKLKSGIQIQREYAKNIPRIQAYGSELNQVWTNIIDNAVDAMDGVGRMIIRTSYQAPWVRVEIEDNGPGISPEVQSRLFTPFFTTKPVGKGTGLGLNISYNIVQKHHGEIKVYSEPGRTRFEVSLPVNRETGNSATPQDSSAPGA